MAVELTHQPRDNPEAKARSRLVDVEAFGKADAAIGNLDPKAPVDLMSGNVNHAASIRISVLHRVGHKLIDQKTQRNGMASRKQYRVGAASQNTRPRGALQSSAKFVDEIRKIDEADPRAPPQMVMDLRNGRYARASLLEGVPDLIRKRTARPDLRQSHDRGKTVLDAMTHFPG